jgi:hypothetical protein
MQLISLKNAIVVRRRFSGLRVYQALARQFGEWLGAQRLKISTFRDSIMRRDRGYVRR